MTPPSPRNESDRLNALHACRVLDTLPEAQYDGIIRLASAICGTPIAAVALIDRDRQWFKSQVGLNATETPRDISFCSRAILSKEMLVVPDAAADICFRKNPLVTGPPYIRFYAGVPLTDPDGFNLGTLCVIDRVPRDLTPVQRDSLITLAGQVVVLLDARRQVARLEKAQADATAEQARFRAFMDNGPAVAFMKDEAGRFVYVNEPLTRHFGCPKEHWLDRTDTDLHGEETGRVLQATDRGILASGETLELYETVPTPDGESFHWHVFKFPFTDATGRRFVAGMAVDRTAEKKAEDALRASEEKFRTVVNGLAEGVLLIAQPCQGSRQLHEPERHECSAFMSFYHGYGDPRGVCQRQLSRGARGKGRNRQQGDEEKDSQADALHIVAFGRDCRDEHAQPNHHADGWEMI